MHLLKEFPINLKTIDCLGYYFTAYAKASLI
jgi:hypothetical protein